MTTASTTPRRKKKTARDWRRQIEQVLRQVPGYNPWDQADAVGAYLDYQAAVDAINWFPEYLRHVEGDARGEPFILRPWQAAIVGNVFGWKRIDDKGRIVRRYRKALLYVPRGNGKTPLAAGLVLHAFYCDDEPGAQNYLAAGQREQAGILFRNARGMVEQEPRLLAATQIYAGDQHRSLVKRDDPLSFCKTIPADAAGQHGGIPAVTVLDELHVQASRDLVDVVETGMSKRVRKQPLFIMITTADFDRPSICNEIYDHACQVRDNGGHKDRPGFDPTFLPVIYEATDKDDWTDPKTWAKANPNLGVSVSQESLAAGVEKARNSVAFQGTLLRLHLNVRTQTAVRWLRLEDWDACAAAGGGPSDPVAWRVALEELLAGRECYGALDLSSKTDLTSWTLVFPPRTRMADYFPIVPALDSGPRSHEPYFLLQRFFAPEESARDRERRDKVPYLVWAKQGFLTLTPGNVVDYEAVKAQAQADARSFDLRQTAYDPWNATQIALQLQQDGASVVEFGQGFKSMSEPAKELEKLVVSHRLAHGGNPILRWMAGHVAIERDASGNIKPSKAKSTERIDGIVTATMALGVAMSDPEGGGGGGGPSVMLLG